MISKRSGRRAARAALVLAVAASASGCTDWAGYDLDYFWGYIPVLSTMRTSVAYDPYEMPRLPAENTIPLDNPQGDVPPAFTQLQLDSVGATLVSPYAGRPPADVLARGEALYERQCAVCHGAQGAGAGPAVGPGKFPYAPPINGSVTAAHSDGYIYGVITVGRALMPPYGHALAHEDRWAVVAYVRQLQAGATGAAPATAAPAATTSPAAGAGATAPAAGQGQDSPPPVTTPGATTDTVSDGQP